MHHCSACFSLNLEATGSCQSCGAPIAMALAPAARLEGEALHQDLLAFVPGRRAGPRHRRSAPRAGPVAIAFTLAIAILVPALLS